MTNHKDLIKSFYSRIDVQSSIILYQEKHIHTGERPSLLGGTLYLLPPVLNDWETCTWTYKAFHMLKTGFEWFEDFNRLDQYLPIKSLDPIFHANSHVLADLTENHELQVYTPPMILWFNVGNHPDSRPYNSVIFESFNQKEIGVVGSKARPWVVFDYWPVRQEVKDFLFKAEKPTEGIFAIETKPDGTITCHIINRDGTIEPEFTVIHKMMLTQQPQFPHEKQDFLLYESQTQLQLWAGDRFHNIFTSNPPQD